jgi:hypothetical protein
LKDRTGDSPEILEKQEQGSGGAEFKRRKTILDDILSYIVVVL